jgi:hypothetical protein
MEYPPAVQQDIRLTPARSSHWRSAAAARLDNVSTAAFNQRSQQGSLQPHATVPSYRIGGNPGAASRTAFYWERDRSSTSHSKPTGISN